MWVLIGLLVVFGGVLALITFLNRRNSTEEVEIKVEIDEECCGAHEVCDKDSLYISDSVIEYFEDEDLDKFSGIKQEDITEEQIEQLSDVFYTLKEGDVAAWLRSLQLRRIELPDFLREQALMVVSERRVVS